MSTRPPHIPLFIFPVAWFFLQSIHTACALPPASSPAQAPTPATPAATFSPDSAPLTPDDFSIGESNVIKLGEDDSWSPDINSLTPEERKKFIGRIRALLYGPSRYNLRNEAIHALLVLKDEEGLKRISGLYHGNDPVSAMQSSYGMEKYGGGEIIPYLIPDVYNDHGKMFGLQPSPEFTARALSAAEAGQTTLPASPPLSRLNLASADLILRCVMTSGEFPEKTKTWAHDLFYKVTSDTTQKAVFHELTVWWEHNKKAILSKQYDKATWLPAEKIKPASPPRSATKTQ